MIGKTTAALAAAIVLASAGAAFAQGNPHSARHVVRQAVPAYTNPYFNKDYWDAIAPQPNIQLHDPYVGTVWENVAPY